MTSSMSMLTPRPGIATAYSRPGRSIAHRIDEASDADIRNLVEGYRLEADVLADAERSFDAWWNRMSEASRLPLDGFQMWRSWRAGWLSMARELGQLPPGSA